MKVHFSKVFANESLKSTFASAIENDSMVHAFILEGAQGSGKLTFALDVAAAMACQAETRPCGVCRSCRRISDRKSPDIIIDQLSEDKSFIPIDTVRDIRESAAGVPLELDFKMYIIRDSDKMTVQAQNALLKILEEPPSFVYFALLCTNSALLLPTIKSRAPVFRMQRFTDQELSEYFIQNSSEAKKLSERDPAAFLRIIRFGAGSIGAVKEHMDKRSLDSVQKRYSEICGFFEALSSSVKSDFVRFEDVLPSKREELSDYLSDIRSALRDMISAKRSIVVEYIYFDSLETAFGFSQCFTVESLIKMLKLTDDYLVSNDLFGNINLLKISYICGMYEIVHT